jgi:hypothetical protein
MTYTSPGERDPRLWELARKRVGFKSNLASYVTVNLFLWILWFITTGPSDRSGWPWPIWSTLGWGIGIVFHYLETYVFPKANAVEREYEKLKQNQS